MIETQQLLTIMVVFVGLVAIAMLATACFAFLALRRLQELNRRATEFMDQWQPMAATTRQAVDEFSQQSGELLGRLNTVSAILHKQALRADSILGGLLASARGNIKGVDEQLRRTLDRIEETTGVLARALQASAHQARGLAAGLTAVLKHLSQSRKGEPGRVSTDEEMFI